MNIPITSLTFLLAFLTGCMGAWFAHRRKKNIYLWFTIGFFFGILGAFLIFFIPQKKKKPAALQKPEPLPPSILGPSDKFWYYLTTEHEQVGPMSHAALTSAFRQGKISPTTFVWNEELPDWKPLEDMIQAHS